MSDDTTIYMIGIVVGVIVGITSTLAMRVISDNGSLFAQPEEDE